MIATQGASWRFFLPTHFGNIACSFASEEINDGVLKEAANATPKILINIPTITKMYPHLPTPVPKAFAIGVLYFDILVPKIPIATSIISEYIIVTLTITAINTRGIFFSGSVICFAAIGIKEKPVNI